jgi:hypothetical protein
MEAFRVCKMWPAFNVATNRLDVINNRNFELCRGTVTIEEDFTKSAQKSRRVLS